MARKRLRKILAGVIAILMILTMNTPAIVSYANNVGASFIVENNGSPNKNIQTQDDGDNESSTNTENLYINDAGQILIYHFQQLALIGSGAVVTTSDFDSDSVGQGQPVLNENGDVLTYSPFADYCIAEDIVFPEGQSWNLPQNMTGVIVGSTVSDETVLYDETSDSLYLYNPYQLAILNSEDGAIQPVLSGDAAAETFGTGQLIYPTEADEFLTYSISHQIILSKSFSSVVTEKPVSIESKAAPIKNLRGPADTKAGRDFPGQVLKTLNGKTYILVGNQEQLRAIGSGQEVLTAVYQTRLNGIQYEVDTAGANNGMLYGGDADLLQSQNGEADFNFQNVLSADLLRHRSGVDQQTGEVILSAALNTWKTGHYYSSTENYIIFRDIDLGGSENPWTPLMFSGFMQGAVAENGEDLWDTTSITASRQAVISNVYINQTAPIEVNKYIGIGFFATITNEINTANVGISKGTVTVSNIELNQVEVHNTSTTAKAANTIVNALTSTLGWLVGGLVDLLTTAISFGSVHLSLRDTLSNMLNARTQDPTIYATGGFVGRVIGDVHISNCSVTGSVTVENHKDYTGGFVGYSDGMTEYNGLSNALGITTDALASLLNVIPGLGLGDLITILLGGNNTLPLQNLIPTNYLNPHMDNCYVDGLEGSLGQADTNGNGGFAGCVIGTQIHGSYIQNSTYTVNAQEYGGGFVGVAHDAEVIGTLSDLGLNIIDESRIQSVNNTLDNFGNFQTQSLLQDCGIYDSSITVTGGDNLGGFVGALAASYCIDCDIKGQQSETLTVIGSGSSIGGVAGIGTMGWLNSLGKSETAGSNSLLSAVRQIATGLLSSENESQSQKLLSLVGLVPSAVMGAQVEMSEVTVSGGGNDIGGIIGKGQGIYLTESSDTYLNQLTFWEQNNITGKTSRSNILSHLVVVEGGGDCIGGVAGRLETVNIAGVLDGTLSAGSFHGFTVSDVTVIGIADGYTVTSTGEYTNADGEDVGGGFGKVYGGTIHNAHLYQVLSVETEKTRAAGFVGTAGPGEVLSSGGLTINLLGLNQLINVKNLLSIGQDIRVVFTDCSVNGIEDGMNIQAHGHGSSNDGVRYIAAGFIAQSNSVEMNHCHVRNLNSVITDDTHGYSGGFIGVSETGGLADVSDTDGVKGLLNIEGGLLNAVEYLIPVYTNCTTSFIDGGFVEGDIAGGFVAEMQSGTVDNANIAQIDNVNEPEYTKMIPSIYDPQAGSQSLKTKQFAVFNIDAVNGQTYAGGFGGKVYSGALASSSGGISILGNTELSINVNDLVSVVSAYVPTVHHAGVYSENGFTVTATEIRNDDPASGSAGGFIGYASGAQISNSDVFQLKHTEVTPPEDLEAVVANSYYTDSEYAVTGGHYAGGYIGDIEVGDAASLGQGLKILGSSIQLTNILSALNVVVTTIEHSDVRGKAGGFAVMATGLEANSNKVGMAGGFAGSLYGGHVQNSHCVNFSYIIGQEAAGGYVGNMEPGDVAKILDNGSILGSLIDIDEALASLVTDFVPTVRNSTTSCIPCGGAVRADAASDSSHQRGMAGGYCGHNEGGHIWGNNTKTWKDQNDGVLLGQNTGLNTVGEYTGEQHICTAWRIRSVYGYEYAGGFTGFMESADTANTGSIHLLGGLLSLNNILSALSAVYPTEENTAVYGPLANMDYTTWNQWLTYVGSYGALGYELAQIGAVADQQELDAMIDQYQYGYHVVAGRSTHDQTLITEGGNAGGYVGYMLTGVITNAQAYQTKFVQAFRSAGGFAGKMQAGGAADFGSFSLLGLKANLGTLISAVEVFVPTIKSSTVHGWNDGLTIIATGSDFTHGSGYAGGYAGSGYGAQIWGDKNIGNLSGTGCDVENLRFVFGNNSVGGYIGIADAASIANLNTNASEGVLQALLSDLISTPNSLASVLKATMTTIRQASVSADDEDFGFVVNGYNDAVPQFAGGFVGFAEAAVLGDIHGNSTLHVQNIRHAKGKYYAGGFVGLADVGGVARVSSGNGGTTILSLINAGTVDLLDVFRTYIYYAEVDGVEEGLIVTTNESAQEGILSETRYSGCSGGFGGGVMNGTVRNSSVSNVNTVTGRNYTGGFIGHMGKNGLVDVDDATVSQLLGLTAGVLDIGGTTVHDCNVSGMETGMIIQSLSGEDPIAGGFVGYADIAQIHDSTADNLKLVLSDVIAGGFVGKANMNYLVNAEVDSALVQIVLQILNGLLGILQIAPLENLDLLNLDLGILNLKLLTDGDVLYVNLFGLKIGVSLLVPETETTGTVKVTIGDSTVELPYHENGIDTNQENAEVVVNLIKGNRTRVDNSSVTGIPAGYDVYGGGATNTEDGTDNNGYAGGFVGYNNEGRFRNNEMLYCDVIRGSAQKVGVFSGGTSLQSVYSFNTLNSIEGDNNQYHIYRVTEADMLKTANGASIGSVAQTDTATPITYQRFDVTHLALPIRPADNAPYYTLFQQYENAKLVDSSDAVEEEDADIYISNAKAVLMLDIPSKPNDEGLIPVPAERQDPCEETAILTIRKIWDDWNDFDNQRPHDIHIRIWQTKTEIADASVSSTPVIYTDNLTTDADGWMSITEMSAFEDTSTWSMKIPNVPSIDYQVDSVSGTLVPYAYYHYTIEEKPVSGYQTLITQDDDYTFTVKNTHRPILPLSGGIGDWIWVIAGVILIGAGIFILCQQKSKQKPKENNDEQKEQSIRDAEEIQQQSSENQK